MVIGISPNGEEFQFYNQSEFARQHGLRQSSIGDCLNNKCKTHKGWKFIIKNNSYNRLETIESIIQEKSLYEEASRVHSK